MQEISWQYEPVDLDGWLPDFLVSWWCSPRCGDFVVDGRHQILVKVKPYTSLDPFEHLPCQNYETWAEGFAAVRENGFLYCRIGCFGFHLDVAQFGMVHGHGGGYYSLDWIEKYDHESR